MGAIDKPFKVLATAIAYVGKLSARHPIHTLIVTSLFAAIAYLSVVEQYISEGFSYDEASAPVLTYYHPAPGKGPDAWVALEDPSTLDNAVEHLNVIPFHFGRVDNHELPEVAGSFNDEANMLKFIITPGDENAEAESASELTAQDGTVWQFRNHHAKFGKYSDYAIKAFNKVSKLIRGAEPFDIALVTFAYIAMWYTFISLFLKMRQAGSRFWLAFSILASSFYAFLFALYTTTRYLSLPISIISLTEGVPFFVATIGFKNKIILTQKVLTKYSGKEFWKKGSSNVLFHALKDQGVPFLRDHLLVTFAFLACSVYASHLEGLRNFCIFAALILVFDIITTCTFLAGILSLKLEINLIHRSTLLKQALEEDGLTDHTVDDVLKSSNLSSSPETFHDASSSSSVTIAKVLGIIMIGGLQVLGIGSAWFSEYKSSSEYIESTIFYNSIAEHINVGSKGTLVTLYPPRFFLPTKFTIQVENLILAVLSYVSSAIRDKYISKFVLFSFSISVFINIYLLNAARIHSSSVEKDVEVSKPKKVTKTVEADSKLKTKTKTATKSTTSPINEQSDDSSSADTKASEILQSSDSENEQPLRPYEKIVELYKDGKVKSLHNDEVAQLAVKGSLPLYALEKQLGDTTRAVAVRRKAIAKLADAPVLETSKLPYLHYDYDRVFGACCENVIGYMPLPVGIAGPLIIDGKPYHIPMATTEGCLVASAMRGCKAINLGGGISTVLTKDGMTRGPVVKFPSLARAGACKLWLDSVEGQDTIKKAFNSTSRFARLQHIQTALAGDLLFIRFRTTTGDAMGMNMISKGVEYSLKQMVEELGWEDMDIISVSGNYCSDKKPAAINWIEGRGKSVVAEAIIPKDAVAKVLKINVPALVELNISKNLIGSAMAGSIGGFNAQAANLLTSVYLALGQDPAQNVESSNCITLMKETKDGDLQISVSMPSIEVGTIGGGTILDPQGSMLELLGVRGPAEVPGENARQLAKIIASIVLAGELSLCSALAAGHLVQSHMQHNRAGAGKK